jgi:hypothetical protein
MSTSTHKFPKVQRYAEKSVPCSGCGKRVRRQKTFWQTVSPLNKLPDGTSKNARDIVGELSDEANAWRLAPEQCAKCRGGAS